MIRHHYTVRAIAAVAGGHRLRPRRDHQGCVRGHICTCGRWCTGQTEHAPAVESFVGNHLHEGLRR